MYTCQLRFPSVCDCYLDLWVAIPGLLLTGLIVTFSSVPEPPNNVMVDAVNSTAIHVKWMPPLKPNGPLKAYTVSFHETENFVLGTVRKVSVMSNVTEALIGGLDPYTNYTVKVNVQNIVGTAVSSEVVIRTRQSGKMLTYVKQTHSLLLRISLLK